METDAYVPQRELLSVRGRLNRDVGAEAATEQWFASRRAEVGGVARPRVIAVRMGDDGTFHWLPRVDVETAGGAPQAR